MVTKCSFDARKNKLDYGRGRACIEMLSKTLRDHAMEIINYKKQEMIPLTDEENKSYEKQKVCHICKKMFCIDENDGNTFKLYHKDRDHCHYTGKFRGATHSICNSRYKVPKGISVMVHNCTAFDDHFIIKQLAKELDGQFESLG